MTSIGIEVNKAPTSSWFAILRALAVVVGVVLANLLVGAVIILLIGSNPLVAFRALLAYSIGDAVTVTNVLIRAAPLVLSGLAVAVAFTAGMYNLGGEGQIYLGAFAAAWVGFSFAALPSALHLPLALFAAMAAGALGAWIPGWMRTRHNVDEVISTLLLNYVYILFTGYLATYPFRDPQRWSGTTPQIYQSAYLPTIWPRTGLNAGILIAIAAAGIIYLVLRYTDIGYRWKITGLNARFARYAGLEVSRDQLSAMMWSGAIAGLAGGLLVAGSQYRFWAQIGGGIGWDGILIGLLAANHPLAVLVAGIAFSAVKTGSLGMEQASSVPSELTNVLLALLILLVTGRQFVLLALNRARASVE